MKAKQIIESYGKLGNSVQHHSNAQISAEFLRVINEEECDKKEGCDKKEQDAVDELMGVLEQDDPAGEATEPMFKNALARQEAKMLFQKMKPFVEGLSDVEFHALASVMLEVLKGIAMGNKKMSWDATREVLAIVKENLK